ncbi:GTPase IMAP family member 4-like [Sinocyclocheilus rhinocerous]|uniref:GTPase IMAP family member 4-like n=1 Tax=Sinocyclocheilus rhinocerous TaxID=307959 RepID=UPI0007B8EDDD|nr:PREDICTED: GTPase IMAP family member 4-like [Sinocyclocheilus rhinocerous]
MFCIYQHEFFSPVGLQAQSSSKPTELRIVLLRKTGVGKSSAGNTILGESIFKYKKSLNSVTKCCSVGRSVVKGRTLSVIDTPGFFDTTLPREKMTVEMANSVFLPAPGPHAFLFVLPVDRFTKQEEQVLAQIQMIFGEDVLTYLIILFTNGDDIDPETFGTEVNGHNILRPIVERCQGRFHVFTNKDENNREQVYDLLQKIDTMIEQNGGGHYSNHMFQEAQRFRQEEEIRNREEADDREEQYNDQCRGAKSHPSSRKRTPLPLERKRDESNLLLENPINISPWPPARVQTRRKGIREEEKCRKEDRLHNHTVDGEEERQLGTD